MHYKKPPVSPVPTECPLSRLDGTGDYSDSRAGSSRKTRAGSRFPGGHRPYRPPLLEAIAAPPEAESRLEDEWP